MKRCRFDDDFDGADINDDCDDNGSDENDDDDDDVKPEQHGDGGVKRMKSKRGRTDLVINFNLQL